MGKHISSRIEIVASLCFAIDVQNKEKPLTLRNCINV